MTNLLLPLLAVGGVYWLYSSNKEEEERMAAKEAKEGEVDLVDALRREVDLMRTEAGASEIVQKAEEIAEVAE
jgi:hypothetical protein